MAKTKTTIEVVPTPPSLSSQKEKNQPTKDALIERGVTLAVEMISCISTSKTAFEKGQQLLEELEKDLELLRTISKNAAESKLLEKEAESLEEELEEVRGIVENQQDQPDDIADVIQEVLDCTPDHLLRKRMEGLRDALRRQNRPTGDYEEVDRGLLLQRALQYA